MAYELLKGIYTVPTSQLSATGSHNGPPSSYIATGRCGGKGGMTLYQTLFFNVCDILCLSVTMQGDPRDSHLHTSYNVNALMYIKAVEAPDNIKPVHFLGEPFNNTDDISSHFYYSYTWQEIFNHYCPRTGPGELRLIDMLEYNSEYGYGFTLHKFNSSSTDYKYDPNKTLNKLKEIARTTGAYFRINRQSYFDFDDLLGGSITNKIPCTEFSLIVPKTPYEDLANSTNIIKTNIDNINIQPIYDKVRRDHNLGVSNYNGCLSAIQHINNG